MSPALKGAGPIHPNASAALKPEARHGREGTHQRRRMFPSVPQRRPPIVPNTKRPSTAFASSAVQYDLNAADLLEGGLDLGQKE